MRIKTVIGIFVLIAFPLTNVDHAFSQYDDEMLKKMEADEELQQEFKWLKAETYVITASKVMEEIKKAPASITVITDRQIQQMGAKHLADVLRIVPGMHPWYTHVGSHILQVRRAWAGAASNKVLVLLNSHPLNSTFNGGATQNHDTLIIDNIKRIEVIRGPGSAVYGANAYLGVINVITKNAEDIDGFEFTARGGSWDTQQYNLLYGKTFRELEVAFNFNYFKTHGFRGLIEEDYQTYLDTLTDPLPNASLAPGPMPADDEKYDVSLNLKYKGIKFAGRYIDREFDLPVGWQATLNHKTISDEDDYYLTLSYETSILEGLDISGKAYRNFEDYYYPSQLFPPGMVVSTPITPTNPFGFEILSDGWIEIHGMKTCRNGIEIQATYLMSDSNTVVAGATYEEMKQYDPIRRGNTRPTDDPLVVIPLPSVQDYPDKYAEDTEKINFKAVFVEDIWDITDDLRLTTGARYDRYSNFGGEFSPRVGLTWEYIEGYDLKLLYGHAFRAPSFYELYNNFGGNPDLDPESIDTYEASLGADFNSSVSARITGYYGREKDTIWPGGSGVDFIHRNLGKSRFRGFELELKYDLGRGTYLAGNYSYGSGQSGNANSPRHSGIIMANIRLSRYLNFFANCYFKDDFGRFDVDSRDDPSGYAVVNTTLIAKKFLKGFKGLELRASVYNLLDKDYTSPQEPRLPNDLPMPGRNYMFELKYTF